jgi:hypothetical protein
MSSMTFPEPVPVHVSRRRLQIVAAASALALTGLTLAWVLDGSAANISVRSIAPRFHDRVASVQAAGDVRPVRITDYLRTSSARPSNVHATVAGLTDTSVRASGSSPAVQPAPIPAIACRIGTSAATSVASASVCAAPLPRQVVMGVPQVGVHLPRVTGPSVSIGRLPSASRAGRTVTVDIGLDPQVNGPSVTLGTPATLTPASVESR